MWITYVIAPWPASTIKHKWRRNRTYSGTIGRLRRMIS